MLQYISQLSWAQVLLNPSDSQGVRAAVMGELRSPSTVCGAESWMMTGTLRMPMWCADSSSVELLRKPITFQSLSVAWVLLAWGVSSALEMRPSWCSATPPIIRQCQWEFLKTLVWFVQVSHCVKGTECFLGFIQPTCAVASQILSWHESELDDS